MHRIRDVPYEGYGDQDILSSHNKFLGNCFVISNGNVPHEPLKHIYGFSDKLGCSGKHCLPWNPTKRKSKYGIILKHRLNWIFRVYLYHRTTRFIPKPINVFYGSIGNITRWNYEAVAQNFVMGRWNIFVTTALIRNVSYFVCKVCKSEHIINAPQKKELLRYLLDFNCQQNS